MNGLNLIRWLDDNQIHYELYGNKEVGIRDYSGLFQYKPGTITWMRKEKNLKTSKVTEQIACIITDRTVAFREQFALQVRVENPQYVFFSFVEDIFENKPSRVNGTTNIIHATAIIHPSVKIGNFCVIEENVHVGEGTTLDDYIAIRRNTEIGRNCRIESQVSIGNAGHNYARSPKGIWRNAPHLGRVVIKDNVEICLNSIINRGIMEDTIIENNVKIFQNCAIAHNSHIGANTLIIDGTIIMGSAKIGENCWISTSIIHNQINIGNNVTVGMGSVVVKDIPDGCTVFGNPATLLFKGTNVCIENSQKE